MLVSHDRALVRSVCDEFWMASRGGVRAFDGKLDDFQCYLTNKAKRQRDAVKKASTAAASDCEDCSEGGGKVLSFLCMSRIALDGHTP